MNQWSLSRKQDWSHHTWAWVPAQGGSLNCRPGGVVAGGQKVSVNFVLKHFSEKSAFLRKNTIFERFFDFFYLKILVFSSIFIDFLKLFFSF